MLTRGVHVAVFFKELSARKPVVSSGHTGVWIHASGQVAVLLDYGADITPLLVELDQRLGQQPNLGVGHLPATWDALTAMSAAGTVRGVALLFCDGHQVTWRTRGTVNVVAAAGLAARHRQVGVRPAEGTVSLEGGEFFLATSAAVAAPALAPNLRGIDQVSYENLQQALDQAAGRKDWRALLFPAEAISTFINPAWPYNPFAGSPESGAHERLGWRRLADALFAEPDFSGFRIIGGNYFAKGGQSRFLDGLLASPWGVFLLELKDNFGRVRLAMQTRNDGMIAYHPNGSEMKRFVNPVFKIEEALRLAQKDFIGVRLEPNLRKGGILLFTNPDGQVNCIDPSGRSFGIPYISGNVLIGSPTTVAEQIRKFAPLVGLRGTPPLVSPAQIKQIETYLGGDTVPREATKPAGKGPQKPKAPALRIRRFLIDDQPLPGESNPRYDTLTVAVDGKERHLWAKRYRLTAMGHDADLEDEVARVGREIAALQDLSRQPGVQKYWEHFVDGLFLYVILEPADGMRLDQWLTKTKPDRPARLRMLQNLATILESLANESIVHRALTPGNVRVQPDGGTTLINFELCQLVSVATVDSRTRESLDAAYLSSEAMTPGRQLSPADDSFSFGKLASLILAGRLPFERPGEDARLIARPAGWMEFARDHGLTETQTDGLRRLLSRDRRLRPTGADLVQMVKGWEN